MTELLGCGVARRLAAVGRSVEALCFEWRNLLSWSVARTTPEMVTGSIFLCTPEDGVHIYVALHLGRAATGELDVRYGLRLVENGDHGAGQRLSWVHNARTSANVSFIALAEGAMSAPRLTILSIHRITSLAEQGFPYVPTGLPGHAPHPGNPAAT